MDKTAAFQNYDDRTDPATCAPRLAALRAELAKRGLDGFVVPHSDAHQSEYLPAHAERLAWLTAFTGSAGAAVVLKDRAAIFVDGRYTLQVARQTDTQLFTPGDLVAEGPAAWVAKNLPKGAKLGFDPWLHTAHATHALGAAAMRAGGTLVACENNPLDAVWHDQPAPPREKAMAQPLELAGEASESKRQRIARQIKAQGAEAAILTLADSICWLANIRGRDVPHTPFVLAFALLHADAHLDLFVDARKITPELLAHLGPQVHQYEPADFLPALDAFAGKTVIADPASAAAAIFARLERAGARVLREADPCQLPKACKNSIEIAGARKAHIRDGAALCAFLAWFEGAAADGGLTEIDAAEKLEGFRRATGMLCDLSFDSIAGAGANGAVVHYRVTHSSNRAILPGEIFLIDSGAQYPDGTTDVTRTVIVGTATAQMCDRFTRVLKGHIALATAHFPEGTTGSQLDAFARRPLWEAGLDYDHGTGHGVGAYLSVHEGPQNISKRAVMQALRPGMICSNEPGFYKEGEYGIRIENLVVVTPPQMRPGAERAMMGFETITLAPIDLNLVEPALLTGEERAWLNDYHARVRETLTPLADADVKAWLEKATRAL